LQRPFLVPVAVFFLDGMNLFSFGIAICDYADYSFVFFCKCAEEYIVCVLSLPLGWNLECPKKRPNQNLFWASLCL